MRENLLKLLEKGFKRGKMFLRTAGSKLWEFAAIGGGGGRQCQQVRKGVRQIHRKQLHKQVLKGTERDMPPDILHATTVVVG